MLADRTFLRGFLTRKNMPAVQTHPCTFHIRNKQLILLNEVSKPAESVAVYLLNLRNLVERCRDFRKALLHRLIPECLIHRVMFFIFIMLGKAQQFQNRLGNIHRITSVNLNGFPCHFLQMVIKHLCMFLFLVCRKCEYRFHDMEFLLLCLLRRKSIAVSCLTFPCKGAHQIQFCFARFEIHSHFYFPPDFSCHYYSISCSAFAFKISHLRSISFWMPAVTQE